jgi:hypothetical protein
MRKNREKESGGGGNVEEKAVEDVRGNKSPGEVGRIRESREVESGRREKCRGKSHRRREGE